MVIDQVLVTVLVEVSDGAMLTFIDIKETRNKAIPMVTALATLIVIAKVMDSVLF